MKKIIVIAAVILLVLSMAACTSGGSNTADTSSTPPPATDDSQATATPPDTAAPASDILIGSCVYKFDDTFMTGVRNAMQAKADTLGVQLETMDSQNKQPTQNEQVDTFITKGVNALCINPVDLTASGPIVDKAKAAGVPIVLYNREPDASVLQSYDQAWYVGAKAEESGVQSGTILVDNWKQHPEWDKNGDGMIQYVLLQGEIGHQDATLRSQYSQKTLQDAGLITGFDFDNWNQLNSCLLATDTATWDKVKATDLMKTWIASIGLDKIEAVIANNDDMALGAIEALKAEGYNSGDASKYIPVVGVDATAPALDAMKDGSLLGTVLNDAVNQGNATVAIAYAAASGQSIDKSTVGYDISDGKYVWVPYVMVTADNYTDFMN